MAHMSQGQILALAFRGTSMKRSNVFRLRSKAGWGTTGCRVPDRLSMCVCVVETERGGGRGSGREIEREKER